MFFVVFLGFLGGQGCSAVRVSTAGSVGVGRCGSVWVGVGRYSVRLVSSFNPPRACRRQAAGRGAAGGSSMAWPDHNDGGGGLTVEEDIGDGSLASHLLQRGL